MSLRLSIIIPFFNVERYIADCLESVYSQDMPEEEYEVICVDDCSQDKSISIVKAFAKEHSNLKIVRNSENRKLGGARNAGMRVAKGNYIWFVDSDDFIEVNVMNSLCSLAERDNLDVLHFNYCNYPSKPTSHILPDIQGVMTGAEIFFDKRFLWYHDLVTAWRKLYKRSFLDNNGIIFAEHIMFEDNDYAIQVFAYANRVEHISLDAYYYRANPESITRTHLSSQHVFYWLALSHRLVALKNQLAGDQRDGRFQKLLNGFIRYEVHQVMSVYHSLETEEAGKAKKMIRKELDKSLKEFTSKRVYYRIKLGLF